MFIKYLVLSLIYFFSIGIFPCVAATLDSKLMTDSPKELTQFCRSHGVNIFGVQYLKYPDSTKYYPTVNPNAPKGGEINLSWRDGFTKKNPMSLGGSPIPGYWLAFQTLAEMSFDDDDALSCYGLLAEWIEIAKDKKSMLIKLRDNTAFSDGVPLTTNDVLFSWEIAQDPAYLPTTRIILKDVDEFIALDSKLFKVTFKDWNRELPTTILGNLFILPKHIYGRPGTDFSKDFNDVDPVGSGPYTVYKADQSSFVSWKKNQNYWANELWLMKGRYNFDMITYKFYTESHAMREAFLAGHLDVMDVNSARDWAEVLTAKNNKSIANGYIQRDEIESTLLPPVQCFVFNTRRTVFDDIRVRKAIASLFDFDNLNRNLFFDSYVRQNRFYGCPDMFTQGPAKDSELENLLDLRARHNDSEKRIAYVPKSAITTGMQQMGYDLKGRSIPLDERILLASAYLDSAGWIYDPIDKVRKKNGIPLQFEILLAGTDGSHVRTISPFFNTLKEVGIRTTYKESQMPEYTERVNKYDYDMIIHIFFASRSPGIELSEYWHSQSADERGSRNFCGVKNPAVDEVVSKIVQFEDREQTYLYAKILDRILWNNYYIIPQWYLPTRRGVYWNKYSTAKPFGQMIYLFSSINFWWYDANKHEALKKAMKERETLIKEEDQ